MIFLTVGHQTPFDRLVKAVDEWAARNRDVRVFAQIGEGKYKPSTIEYERWLTPVRFAECIDSCSGVVSHAGTGTIVQVLMKQKPLLVLPRRAVNNETRNDHQLGTARYFAEQGFLLAVKDEMELASGIQRLMTWSPSGAIARQASQQLLSTIRDFIDDKAQ